jgi:hypothetical protein
MDLASFSMMNLHLRIGQRTTDNLTLCISVVPATMPLGGYMQDPSSHAPSVNFAKAIEAFHPHILFIAIS